VCADFEGTSLEFIPDSMNNFDAAVEAMIQMSVAAQRTINWNLLPVDAAERDNANRKLEAGTRARERGGRLVALTMPFSMGLRYSFRTGFLLDSIPGWAKPMALPIDEKLALFRNRA